IRGQRPRGPGDGIDRTGRWAWIATAMAAAIGGGGRSPLAALPPATLRLDAGPSPQPCRQLFLRWWGLRRRRSWPRVLRRRRFRRRGFRWRRLLVAAWPRAAEGRVCGLRGC